MLPSSTKNSTNPEKLPKTKIILHKPREALFKPREALKKPRQALHKQTEALQKTKEALILPLRCESSPKLR